MKPKTDLAQEGRKLAAAFRKKSINLESKKDQALFKGASSVQRRAKKLAPVDSGKLRNSIAIRQEKNEKGETVFVVGTNVDYAVHQEYGTHKDEGKPFLRPALYAARPFIEKMLKDALGDALDD